MHGNNDGVEKRVSHLLQIGSGGIAGRVTMMDREASLLEPIAQPLNCRGVQVAGPHGTHQRCAVEAAGFLQVRDHAGPEQHHRLRRRAG